MTATIELVGEGLRFRLTYIYTPGTPARTDGPPEDCTTGEDEILDISKVEYFLQRTFQVDLWCDLTALVQSEYCLHLAEVLQEKLLDELRGG